MPRHLTARMAWHDGKWDGKVCQNPESNVYCTGTHSLLSDRLAREKDTEIENQNTRKKIDQIPNYIPPCFWSINAFSSQPADIVHVHPFSQYKNKTIREKLQARSIFTWPFRLSYNHSTDKKKREGKYPKDLEDRIKQFRSKFELGKSFIFFYLNYSNPISTDDSVLGDKYSYCLVGCSVLTDKGEPTYFPFTNEELEQIRRPKPMKYFPSINWALQFSFDPSKTIVLPYQEYLQHPEGKQKLDEIKVVIEEEALIPRFKYVSEELDDDKCIYLLYKLRKAIGFVQQHGIVNFNQKEALIEDLSKTAWERRGLYPSLGKIVELLENDDNFDETGMGNELVSAIQKFIPPNKDLLEAVFELLHGSDAVPKHLDQFRDFMEGARSGFQAHSTLENLFKKLSLFSLTKYQIWRVLFDRPFGGKEIAPDDIVANPYLLCEYYLPDEPNLDAPEYREEPIGLFTIDFGMFSDRKYLKECNRELQNLNPAGPERMRALVVEYLRKIGSQGHCFATLDAVYENLLKHPLLYKQTLSLNKTELVKGKHLEHFHDRLEIVPDEGQFYFYLREVEYAERLIEKVVGDLIERKEYNVRLDWLDTYLQSESQNLGKQIQGFSKEQFAEERRCLFEGSLSRSFFVITGKPGSGKTQALKEIVKELQKLGQNITLLAPTGKAALRLREKTQFQEAQTIDMFLYRNGYGPCLENFENIVNFQKKREMPSIENLVIDECSMVDLQKLAVLFIIIRQNFGRVRRVIFVGDENQLPPIGYGRPFFDVIEFLKQDKHRYIKHLVRLVTNCRIAFDKKILNAVDIFMSRNRYYEELLEEMKNGGKIGDGLTVELWNTREELFSKIDKRLQEIIQVELQNERIGDKFCDLNKLFGLASDGSLPSSLKELTLNNLQLITPYNGDFYGTLGINRFVGQEYKKRDQRIGPFHLFAHSDKVIRLVNWYRFNPEERKKELELPNGSIGVVGDGDRKFRWWFPDFDKQFYGVDREENFGLAYAITIHKSQGSEFKNVFVIIPKERSLLSNELLYTALSRPTHRITVFLQQDERESPLEVARKRSFSLERNTSLFSRPRDVRVVLEPEPGVRVRSRAEYIIYRALMGGKEEGKLDFKYERELELKNKKYRIHPDFTVYVGGKTYYWEHLGELDQREYYTNWKERRRDYEINGYGEVLLTTDEIWGIKQEQIQQVIQDVINGTLQVTKDSRFSNHHYKLYEE